MKSPLRKFQKFVHKSEQKEKKDTRHPAAKLDELVQATQDMLDMRSCYDSLLEAAAATANTAFEFSEALEEMGRCLLEKTALNDDEDSGRVLLMLGKTQFELQSLVNSYRAHVIQTITTPSESLLKELQTVEEMKRQCDSKRDLYKFMLAAQRQKGKSKHAKGETFTSPQILEAQEQYEEEANIFVFRLKSLKQGQSRSLLTQAARHHAAQLTFFRKGLKSLETVEPHVQVVASREHIDYQFSGLEDDSTDDDDSYGSDDGELSFDYGDDESVHDVPVVATKSMETQLDEVNQPARQSTTRELAREDILDARRTSTITQSEPLLPHKKMDPFELRPSSTRKLHTYALPTPGDAMRSISTGSVYRSSTQFWPTIPPRVNSPHRSPVSGSEKKKMKLHYTSGPLMSQHFSSSSPNINELHELPRPPSRRPTNVLGHSAPLVYRQVETGSGTSSITSITASPLPTPPPAYARSFSIPSRSQRMTMSSDMTEDVGLQSVTAIPEERETL